MAQFHANPNPTDPEAYDEYLDEELRDARGDLDAELVAGLDAEPVGGRNQGRRAVVSGSPYGGRLLDDLGEAPEADAAEQRIDVLELDDIPLTGRELDMADPADAVEQTRVVDPGDDEYR